MNRRTFLIQSACATVGAGLAGCTALGTRSKPRFEISLAQWSLHKALFGKHLDPLDFPKASRLDYGISAVELVNQFYKDKARDTGYLSELKRRAADNGVRILLIMIDGEGALGDADPTKRAQAVVNHHRWVEAAKYFGCHSIRVNAETGPTGSFEEKQDRAADGLRALSEFARGFGLNVIVENHGGLSSNGAWLAGVMRKVKLPNCGTLPDFGNFNLGNGQTYDRYLGVRELMPFAKAVSAKSHDFDAAGNEIHTDYHRMMRIVLEAGYRGFVGIEYEGSKMSEPEGIRATKQLLERVRAELS
ncbi:MAG: sugar phosphate isomerase/epimerase [Verrucomicrobia bacterium]|nr:sugar phosphate isomerase/epimerase [Verrucomicrobiota bacterium]